MTGLRGQVRGYLALRRAMGFKMEKHGPLLDSLAGYLEGAGLATVTTQAAVEWAMLPQGVHPHRWKQRLDAARGFARYLAASDPAAEVPPAGLLDARPNRHEPYIFTRQEISTLLAAAGQHRWHLPAVTYPALFGLIASTGMRLSEATRLDDSDADLDEAMITIRDSKFGKSRRIPVDATVVTALRDYRAGAGPCDRRRQRRRCSSPPTGPGSSATMPRPSSAGSPRRPGPAPAPPAPRESTIFATLLRSGRWPAGIATAGTSRPGCRCCPLISGMCALSRHTGITPIPGLFRYLLLCARDGSVAWDDALWRLSPVGIIRCHSLSPQRRWMMSSRSCHNGTGRGLCVVALFAFSRAWRFISVSACA